MQGQTAPSDSGPGFICLEATPPFGYVPSQVLHRVFLVNQGLACPCAAVPPHSWLSLLHPFKVVGASSLSATVLSPLLPFLSLQGLCPLLQPHTDGGSFKICNWFQIYLKFKIYFPVNLINTSFKLFLLPKGWIKTIVFNLSAADPQCTRNTHQTVCMCQNYCLHGYKSTI